MGISRKTGDVQGIASALFRFGKLEQHTGNFDLARSYYEEGFLYLRQLNNQFDIALVIWSLSAVAGHQGDFDQAVRLRQACLHIFREIRQDEKVIEVLGQLGFFAFLAGEYDKALAYCEESLRVARDSDNERALVDTYLALGEVALAEGDHVSARHHFGDALWIASTYSLPPTNSVYALEAMARVAVAEADFERAAVLLGAAEAIHRKIPFLLFPRAKENWQNSLDTTRAHLSAADFAAAWNEGRSLGEKGERHLVACVGCQKRYGRVIARVGRDWPAGPERR